MNFELLGFLIVTYFVGFDYVDILSISDLKS